MRTFYFIEFLLEPDAGNGQGAAGASPPAAPTASAPTPSSQPASPAPTTAATAGASGGSGGGQPATAPSTQGFGTANSPATAATAPQPQAGQFGGPTAPTQPQQPDVTALIRQLPPPFQQLLQMGYQAAAQQRQQAQPVQQPAAPQAQGPKNPFNVPALDFFGLRGYLTRDSQGNLVGTPDAPLDAPQQFKSYVDAFEKAQHGFFQNPQQFLQPIVEEMAAKIAQQQIQQHFSRHQNQSQAQSIYQQVSEWAVAKDANGNPVYDVNPITGAQSERLTPAGQVYHQYLRDAASMGITSPAQRHQYAARLTQAAIIQIQQQQAAAGAQGQQAAQQFVQQAAVNPQVNSPQPTPGNVPPPQPPRSLRESLAEAFSKNGINDTVLANQMQAPQGTAA